MKIGIFGGSFDPPHMGHYWVCKNAVESYGLDKLFIIPNAVSPFKKEKTVESYHIYYMAEAFTREVGGIIDDQEMIRPEPSYTYDTMTHYRKKYPNEELCLIVGGDSLVEFSSWHRAEDIAKIIDRMIVVPRGSDGLGGKASLLHVASILPMIKIFFTKPSFVQISSTELRLRLKIGKIIIGLIPEKVLDYIEVNKLYL